MELLCNLHYEHPERNKNLEGCFYKFKSAKDWKRIKSSFKIAHKTYNELGIAWTDNDIFCWNPD